MKDIFKNLKMSTEKFTQKSDRLVTKRHYSKWQTVEMMTTGSWRTEPSVERCVLHQESSVARDTAIAIPGIQGKKILDNNVEADSAYHDQITRKAASVPSGQESELLTEIISSVLLGSYQINKSPGLDHITAKNIHPRLSSRS